MTCIQFYYELIIIKLYDSSCQGYNEIRLVGIVKIQKEL